MSVLPTSKARSYVSEIFSGLPRDEIEPAELRVIANDLQLCAKRSEDDRIADLLRTASVLCGYYAHVLDVFVAGGAREVPGRDDASRAAVSLLGRTRQALAVDAGLAWSTLAELGTAIR